MINQDEVFVITEDDILKPNDKGKGKGGKLLVNVDGAAVKLHVNPCEIRRVQTTPNATKQAKT